MDKPTLKNNALAAMRACIAHEWSAFNVHGQGMKEKDATRKFYFDCEDLIKIEEEFQMKKCYENLKEYYNG